MVYAAGDPQALARALQEETLHNFRRLSNWMESFVLNPGDPPMGSTPKDVAWKRGKTRLYRYRPQADSIYPVPLVIVPWLGISRSYILDMLPGHSFIEFLVKKGYDVYLLDWGEISEEDKDLGFEDAICKIVPRAVEVALNTSSARQITLNGICLGGTITASYLALNTDAPVRNAINMVSPIDFSEGGLYRTWLDERFFPVDLLVQRYGGIPASLMGAAFKMLRPTLDIQASSGLWFNMDRKEYLSVFKAMSRWANDYIGMPGRFFSQLAKDLYAKNKLMTGQFTLQGEKVDLRKITQPLLAVAARQDYIVPPLSVKGLLNVVSSKEKEYVELSGGHISVFSGREANTNLWPRMDAWLAPRSREKPGVRS